MRGGVISREEPGGGGVWVVRCVEEEGLGEDESSPSSFRPDKITFVGTVLTLRPALDCG
jgi:hypothetical protein